jgi:hypothetical protein
LKNWEVESSDDGALGVEIDRRENSSDINSYSVVKAFAASRSGSFGRIRLCQNGPNDHGNNQLVLSAFEVFGVIARLPGDFLKACFPAEPVFPLTGAKFNDVISYVTARCGCHVHDRDVVEFTSSSNSDLARNAADVETHSEFRSEKKPGQWICLDFTTVTIEPKHYTVQSFYLKYWPVEGSVNEAS